MNNNTRNFIFIVENMFLSTITSKKHKDYLWHKNAFSVGVYQKRKIRNTSLIETPTFKQEKNLGLCEINTIIKSLSR